jgi:hypothetical protein
MHTEAGGSNGWNDHLDKLSHQLGLLIPNCQYFFMADNSILHGSKGITGQL